MLLAVLMLGGTILGVTAIAGFLMLYQIRQSVDFQNSAKSVFAADAGVEWALDNYFQSAQPSPLFGNNASFTVLCYDNADNQLPGCANASSSYAISKGTAGNTKRAFLIEFNGATSTFP